MFRFRFVYCQSLFYEYLIYRWVLSIAYLKTNFWSSSRRVWFWSLHSSSWDISFLPAMSLSCINRWNKEIPHLYHFPPSWCNTDQIQSLSTITWTSLIFFDFSMTFVALASSWSSTWKYSFYVSITFVGYIYASGYCLEHICVCFHISSPFHFVWL